MGSVVDISLDHRGAAVRLRLTLGSEHTEDAGLRIGQEPKHADAEPPARARAE